MPDKQGHVCCRTSSDMKSVFLLYTMGRNLLPQRRLMRPRHCMGVAQRTRNRPTRRVLLRLAPRQSAGGGSRLAFGLPEILLRAPKKSYILYTIYYILYILGHRAAQGSNSTGNGNFNNASRATGSPKKCTCICDGSLHGPAPGY